MCYVVVLHCVVVWACPGTHAFGRVVILVFPGMNVPTWSVVPVQLCPMKLERQQPLLPRKSKVITDPPPYPFIWMFFAPMLSCVVIFLHLFVVLVLLY
jgi:hypothetical protein